MRKDEKLIGAAEERRAVLRKVRRELNAARKDHGNGCWINGDELELWLLDRDKRYNKRPGGLGK